MAKIKINFDKIKGKSNIKEFSLSDNKNQILVENLRLDNFKPIALDKLKVMTFKNGEINNDFSVLIKKILLLKDQVLMQEILLSISTKQIIIIIYYQI